MGVRLQDVAELAGVSMKTVSNVVRDYEHVQRRHPGAGAEGDRRARLPAEPDGPPPGHRAHRASSPCRSPTSTSPTSPSSRASSPPPPSKLGYRVLAGGDRRHARGRAGRARELGVGSGGRDAVPARRRVVAGDLPRRGALPIVILGEGRAPLTLDRIMVDNFAAARDARGTCWLWAAAGGVHRPRGGRASAASSQRIMGYQQALEDGGHPPPTRLLFPGRDHAVGRRRGVGSALDAGVRFDGLICRDDLAAIGALRALQERGIRVPDDVALTGWDNIDDEPRDLPEHHLDRPRHGGPGAHGATEMLVERDRGIRRASDATNSWTHRSCAESAPAASPEPRTGSTVYSAGYFRHAYRHVLMTAPRSRLASARTVATRAPSSCGRCWLDLSGEWDFAFDDDDRGLAPEGWHRDPRLPAHRRALPARVLRLAASTTPGSIASLWYRRRVGPRRSDRRRPR